MEADMNYQEARDNEQLRFLDKSIAEFIKEFRASRQTVIFFPGGLASRLLRAKTPFNADISTPQTFDFEDQEVWLSAWTFGHPELNALKLRMHKEADKFYHDEEDRIIIADGCIKFAGITPYDDLSIGAKITRLICLSSVGIGDGLLAILLIFFWINSCLA
jgi:hypothetical protein